MSIHWTPWRNVPTHRRLELFSMGILFASLLTLGLVSCLLLLYVLVRANRLIEQTHCCNEQLQFALRMSFMWFIILIWYIVLACCEYLLENRLCAVLSVCLLRSTRWRSRRTRRWVRFLSNLYSWLQQIVDDFVFFSVAWIRGLPIWKYCIDYFPLNLVKSVDLAADKNYLVCFFPHGILR